MADVRSNECDFWLWDGATEYEGLLLKLDEKNFSARARQAKKTASTLGKRVAASTIDLQRMFTRKRFLAHVKGSVEGTLFEAAIETVQITSDGEFEFLLAGKFNVLDEKQLELLRNLSAGNAAAILQRHAS